MVQAMKYLNHVASVLQVPIGKISLNENLLPTRVVNDKLIAGNINIVLSLLKETKLSNFKYESTLEEALIRQWIEYAVVYANNASNTQNAYTILKELNELLACNTYLLSYRLTIADVLLYCLLYSIMESLGQLEKEQYLNVSRWFDNIQQDPSLRLSNKLIDFSANYLSSLAPARR